MKFKILNEKYKTKIEYTIIYLLLESREAVYLDGKKATWSWDINNPYYCEAFGMLRSLEIMGYGSLKGEVTLKAPQDLKEWFQELREQTLSVEDLHGGGLQGNRMAWEVYKKLLNN